MRGSDWDGNTRVQAALRTPNPLPKTCN
jgi:hypothetical protein